MCRNTCPFQEELQMKKCTKCGEVKELSEFYKHTTTKDGFVSHCKQCHSLINKKRRENPEYVARQKETMSRWRANSKNKRSILSSAYKTKYGITLEEYEDQFSKQEGKCYICGNTQDKPLYVDHCHKKETIRKLLCQQCNTGLGMFKDNPEIMAKAISYLKEHG